MTEKVHGQNFGTSLLVGDGCWVVTRHVYIKMGRLAHGTGQGKIRPCQRSRIWPGEYRISDGGENFMRNAQKMLCSCSAYCASGTVILLTRYMFGKRVRESHH